VLVTSLTTIWRCGVNPSTPDSVKFANHDARKTNYRFVNFTDSQLFNVRGVKDVGQAEIHTVEPLVPEPSASELELAIDKLESHKSPGIDHILAEQGVEQFAWRFINLLLLFGRRRNCLKSGKSRL